MVLFSFDKARAIALYQKKFSQVEIANKLNVNKITICRLLKKYLKHDSTDRLKGNGRLKVIGSEEMTVIKDALKNKTKTSLRKLSTKLQEAKNKTINHTTIKRRLNEENIYAFSPIKKTLLSKKNIASRMEKTGKMLALSDDKIKTIIISDESKFNLFYSDGKVSV